MRVLVMGGTEFISLHLVRELLAGGHDVTVFNRGKRADRLPGGVHAIAGDRKDHAGLRERLKGRRFEGVFDITYAPTHGEDVAALLAALEGQPHIVFISTGRVYDHSLPIPYSEETARSLYWGEYARHKITSENLLFERHRKGGGPITIVRPTHVMGPLNTRNNETFFMDRIARGRPVLVPGHGGWLRQFGHVEDLAAAMAAMLARVPIVIATEVNISNLLFAHVCGPDRRSDATRVRTPSPSLAAQRICKHLSGPSWAARFRFVTPARLRCD